MLFGALLRATNRACFLVLSFVPQIVLFGAFPRAKNRALDRAFLCSPSCQKSCSRSCSLLQLLVMYLILFVQLYISITPRYIYIYIWTDIHPYFCIYIMHQEVVYNIYIYTHTCTRTHIYIYTYIYTHNLNLHSHVYFYIPYIYVYHCIHPNASLLSTEQFLPGSWQIRILESAGTETWGFLGKLAWELWHHDVYFFAYLII